MQALRRNVKRLATVACVGAMVAGVLLADAPAAEKSPSPTRPQLSIGEFRRAIRAAGVWSGGPDSKYVDVGRQTFATSVSHGLMPHHKVLDIGAGSLRTAWWFLHFVEPANFYAIEPVRERIDTAVALLGVDINVFYNSNWEFPDVDFDFVVARSIWTHASKGMIAKMISEFAENSSPDGRFLTSYRPARSDAEDYKGKEWVGKISRTDKAGMIRHSFEWLREKCLEHGLEVKELDTQYGQVWLLITHEKPAPDGPDAGRRNPFE